MQIIIVDECPTCKGTEKIIRTFVKLDNDLL